MGRDFSPVLNELLNGCKNGVADPFSYVRKVTPYFFKLPLVRLRYLQLKASLKQSHEV